jgi:hypothetical protein
VTIKRESYHLSWPSRGDPLNCGHQEGILSLTAAIKKESYQLSWPSRGDPITCRGYQQGILSINVAIKRGSYHLSWPSRGDPITYRGHQEGILSIIEAIKRESYHISWPSRGSPVTYCGHQNNFSHIEYYQSVSLSSNMKSATNQIFVTFFGRWTIHLWGIVSSLLSYFPETIKESKIVFHWKTLNEKFVIYYILIILHV